jgi:signal peptidase II
MSSPSPPPASNALKSEAKANSRQIIRSLALFAIIAGIGLAADLGTKSAVFAWRGLIFLGGMIYWIATAKSSLGAATLIALGAIAAGILGNLYDRLGLWHFDGLHPQFHYTVRDWILFQYNDNYVWPNFNLADSYLVCAAIYILAWNWFAPNPTAAIGNAKATA